MSKQLVFVYGTLRRGGANDMAELFPRAEFVAGASARGSLYDMGEYPGLLFEEAGALVVGEVYEVDEEILRELDEFEATADYRRRLTEVCLGGRVESCWVYGPPAEVCRRGALITSGDWIVYARAKGGAD